MEEGLVRVNGVLLHYVVKGNGPHTLLCIPGAVGTAKYHYTAQLDYFGREGSDYTLVSFDPRGYGESEVVERQKDVSCYLTDAKDAHGLMQALSHTRYSVFGWCDGGVVAIKLAAIFPESVRSLIVCGTRAYITKDELSFYVKDRDVTKWPPTKMRTFDAVFQVLWDAWIEMITNCYEENDGDICTQDLPKVTCLTLIVHGAKDDMCPLFHGEYLRDHMARNRLEVVKIGKHFLHFKYHEEFNKMVEAFLGEVLESGNGQVSK